MKKFRTIIATIAILLIAYMLITMDYNDLSWSKNKGNYLGVISMLFTTIAMVLSKDIKQ